MSSARIRSSLWCRDGTPTAPPGVAAPVVQPDRANRSETAVPLDFPDQMCYAPLQCPARCRFLSGYRASISGAPPLPRSNMNEDWSGYVCPCGRRLARATVPLTAPQLPIAVDASVFACPRCYTRLPERGFRARWFETNEDGNVARPIPPISPGAPDPHEPDGSNAPPEDAQQQSWADSSAEESPLPWWWDRSRTGPESGPKRPDELPALVGQTQGYPVVPVVALPVIATGLV